MAVDGLESLPALWGTPERYFRRSAELSRAREAVTGFPAPEFTGQWWDGEAPEIAAPLAVRRLVKYAGACGWSVRVRYARGNRQHSRTAKPLGLAHSLAVAMRHPGTPVRAVAVTFRPVSAGSWSWGTFLMSRNGALTSISTYTQFAEHLAVIDSGTFVHAGEE